MLRKLKASIWVVLIAFWISGCTPEATGTFSISGKVNDSDGNALAGVNIVLTGDNSGLVVTSADGSFSFTDLGDGSYVLRANKAGFSFNPARKSVTVSGSDASGNNFTATPTSTTPTAAYTISGRVLDLNGVGLSQVTISAQRSGAPPVTVVTSASGSYALPDLINDTYTVTATLAGYAFIPDSHSITISGTSRSGVNFNVAPGSGTAPTFSVSGRVFTGTNQGVSAVTIELTDGFTSTKATTSTSGDFSFSGLKAGKYVLTPSRSGYLFTPGSTSVDVTDADITGVDFAAATVSAATYSISGSITLASGTGVAGVLVTLSGAGSATAMSNSTGAFVFTNLSNGSYTVAPSLNGYTFDKTSLPATINGANVSGVKFVATPPPEPTFKVSGKITNSDTGNGVTNVTVSLNDAITLQNVATTKSDASGNFSFAGVAAKKYSIAPALSGYTFTPDSMTITVQSTDIANVNFSATPPPAPTFTISGKVTLTGNVPVSGVNVALSGTSSATTTTKTDGTYSFTGIAAGTYKVAPSLTGYTFTPADLSVTVTNANVTNVDFGATAPTLTYTVSGRVTTGTATGPGLAGVSVALSGASSASTTTDSSGNFSFASLAAGSYQLTPTLSGYSFNQPTLSVTVTNADVTNRNFVATAIAVNTYSISGTITVGGAGLSGVAVTLTGAASANTVTNASGQYSFTTLGNGTYTVKPVLAGYTFDQATRTVTVNGANVAGIDFTAQITGPITRDYTLYIVTGMMTISGNGGATIPSWSFTDDATTAKFPGVRLIANEGDTVNVHVTNNHTISHNFQIKGITATLDASPIAPGATKSYTFVADKAGSYLYYDSLNNAINREMGLYGALVVAPPGGASTAWNGGPAFTFERVWVVSDLDKPNWNDVAAAGGNVVTGSYRANYFVINGMGGRAAMDDRIGTAIDGKVGQTALVRILNAGQYTETFHFHANHVKVISVDGVRKTSPFKQLDVLLVPPLSTIEVLFDLNQQGDYPMHNHTAQMETANGAYLNGVGTAIYIAP